MAGQYFLCSWQSEGLAEKRCNQEWGWGQRKILRGTWQWEGNCEDMLLYLLVA